MNFFIIKEQQFSLVKRKKENDFYLKRSIFSARKRAANVTARILLSGSINDQRAIEQLNAIARIRQLRTLMTGSLATAFFIPPRFRARRANEYRVEDARRGKIVQEIGFAKSRCVTNFSWVLVRVGFEARPAFSPSPNRWLVRLAIRQRGNEKKIVTRKESSRVTLTYNDTSAPFVRL